MAAYPYEERLGPKARPAVGTLRSKIEAGAAFGFDSIWRLATRMAVGAPPCIVEHALYYGSRKAKLAEATVSAVGVSCRGAVRLVSEATVSFAKTGNSTGS